MEAEGRIVATCMDRGGLFAKNAINQKTAQRLCPRNKQPGEKYKVLSDELVLNGRLYHLNPVTNTVVPLPRRRTPATEQSETVLEESSATAAKEK